MTTFFIGTYPPDGLGTPPGKGEGVWRASLGAHGELAAEQVIEIDAPSWVSAHPALPLLYAVSETSPTVVSVLSADAPGEVLARVVTGGDFGCHATFLDGGRTLVVAHYGSGDIAVIRLGEDGLPLSDTPDQLLAHQGSGPEEDRQEGPHAHFVTVAPGGRHLLVADLGSDRLWRHRITDDGLLEPDGEAAVLPPGAGPRHLAIRGELIYVVCELDHMLRTYRWDHASAQADLIAELPTTLAPQRTGDTVYDAHVDIVPGLTGDVLLASVRGVDVLAVFDLSPEGEARYRGAIDTGFWPRHFAAVPDAAGVDRLVVAAEKGHEVRAFALADVIGLPPETESGAIAELPYTSVSVTSPACIRPLGA